MVSIEKPEDLWRLKERLGIVEAAILMTDHFPEDVTVRVKNGRIKSDKPIPGLEGAFSALREAAMNGDLPVTWAHDTYTEYEHGYFEHMGIHRLLSALNMARESGYGQADINWAPFGVRKEHLFAV